MAWCIDQAVGTFGNGVLSELSKIEGKNQKQTDMRKERHLNKMLGIEQKFADPAAAVKRGK